MSVQTVMIDNWKESTPHVTIDASGQSTIVLPEGFSLADGQFIRHGNDLLIRSLDGVILSVRGYFDISTAPKLIEFDDPDGSRTAQYESLYAILEEDLGEEELAHEELAEENLGEFVTEAGIGEEPALDIEDHIRVVAGDYTDSTESDVPVDPVQAVPFVSTATQEAAFTPLHDTERPDDLQPETIVDSLVIEPDSKPEPVPIPEPEPVPVPDPEPEPEPEPVPVPEPEPEEDHPKKDKDDDDRGKGHGKDKGKDKDKDDDKDDGGKGHGKDKDKDKDDDDNDQDDEGSAQDVDDETPDDVFVFQQGDGKVKIDDFDINDVIRLEGFDSEDVLIKSKGHNIELTIVGDKGDKLTLQAPHDTDVDSYSITQSDDGSVIVTLDSD